jgi:hypothetical protein
MAKKKSSDPLLRDVLIVQLVQAGVRNHSIRKIAGVQMSRVTRISKLLKKAKKGPV